MRRVLGLALLGMLIGLLGGGAVMADEADTAYRLAKPSVSEFLAATAPIGSLAYREEDLWRLPTTVYLELQARYTSREIAAQPYDLLRAWSNGFAVGDNFLIGPDFVWDDTGERTVWPAVVLAAWLRDNPVDLADPTALQDYFPPFTITPFRLDAAGRRAFMLHHFNQIYAAVEAEPGQYRVYALPVSYISVIPAFTSDSGSFQFPEPRDLNGDGDDEILLLLDNYGNWQNCGTLYVLDWQGERFVDVTEGEFQYCGAHSPPNPFFVRAIGSDKSQVVMRHIIADNWGCHQHVQRFLTPDGAGFAMKSIDFREDSFGCAQRDAEEAMWDEDYLAAIAHYERALRFRAGVALYDEGVLYARARLAVAHWMVGNSARARELLARPIHEQALRMEGRSFGDMILALGEALAAGDDLCRFAFDFVEAAEVEAGYEAYPFPFRIGLTRENTFLPEWQDHVSGGPGGCQAAEPPAPTFAPPTPTPPGTRPALTVYDLESIYRDVTDAWEAGDYAAALGEVDMFLALAPPDETFFIQPARYWRAFSLEMLGREAEALADYVIAYESDPASAWGRLAGMHLVIPLVR
jgi:tetratricopeptide (TPR) repeat protein